MKNPGAPRASKPIHLAAAGIRGELDSDVPEFLEFASRYTAAMQCPSGGQAAGRVVRSRIEAGTLEPPGTGDGWVQEGYRVWTRLGEVVECDPYVGTRAAVGPDAVECTLKMRLPQKRFGPRRWLRGAPPPPHYLYQKTLRYAWHFPMFGVLESRGWALAHASAGARDGRSIMLAGLAGVGKSALLLGLMESSPEWQFITDNYLLVAPGGTVHAFPEPMRTSFEGFARAWRGEASWEPAFQIAERSFFVPPPERLCAEAAPAALVFVVRGERTELAAMSPESAAASLETIGRLTAHEFHYATYVTPLFQGVGGRPSCGALQALLGAARSYRLVVGPGDLRRAVTEVLAPLAD